MPRPVSHIRPRERFPRLENRTLVRTSEMGGGVGSVALNPAAQTGTLAPFAEPCKGSSVPVCLGYGTVAD